MRARQHRLTTFEELPSGCTDEIRLIEAERLQSLAYIPIRSKEKQTFGVIRIGSRTTQQFSPRLRNVLELIGNRIAVAIENAMLQEQVIKSEEKYRSVFNNDPNPIFIISPHTFQILDTNQTARDCYGYTKPELVKLSFFALGEEGDADVRHGFQRLEKGHSIFFPKQRQYKKGRQPFFVNLNVTRAEYGGRDVLIATTTDITATVEKEAQLIQAGKMTTLGVMAAGMAHEINQPLSVIQVSADYILKMLRRGRPLDDAEMKSVAEDIIAHVGRASSVITHVRNFSRQAEIVRSRVDINNPIRDVFKILGHQLKAHEIEVELDLDPDHPADHGGSQPPGAGVREPGEQRHRRHRRKARAPRDRGPNPAAADPLLRRQRPGGRRGERHGHRHAGACQKQALRTLFHHQGNRQGDRPGHEHQLRDRQGLRRPHRRGKRAGTWERISS